MWNDKLVYKVYIWELFVIMFGKNNEVLICGDKLMMTDVRPALGQI